MVLGGLLFLAAAAQAQIAFRSSASATAGAATPISHVGAGAVATRNNCGSVNPAIPAGSAGDVLVALVNSREYSSNVTMAGWTPLYFDSFTGLAAGSEMEVYLFYRVATGGDPNTVTQSGTCSSLAAQIARFAGVDTAQPFEVNPIVAGNVVRQTAGNVDTGTVTTTLDGSMLLVATFVNTRRTVTEGAGWAQSFDSSLNLTRDLGLSLNYQLQASAGAASALNWDLSGGGNNPNYGIIFALRPAADLTINVPAGTALNDVMIASVTVRACSSVDGNPCTLTVIAPAGWTAVATIDQPTGAGTGGFGNRLLVWRRVATAAEPASYSWHFGGTPAHAGAVGAILSFSGVDTTNPIVAAAGQATGVAFTHAAPSVDPGTVANTLLVTSHSANSAATWTPPAGMTERIDATSLAAPNALGLSLEVNHQAIAAASPTGTRTATQSNPPAADTGATHALLLRPLVTLAHYAIAVSSGTVANCDYAEITISGHDVSDTLVSPPSGRSLTLGTSVASGVWQGPGTVAGSGAWTPSGANNGVATYVWPGGESSFTVRLRQSAVTSLTVNLNDGSVVEAALEDPSISFVNSAFRISNGANAAATIGTQIAGKASNTGFGSQTLYLQAVRTDTATGACVSLLPSGSDVSIDVGAQCNTPAACSRNVTLTSSAAAGNTAAFVPDGAYPASMNFRFTTANAEAPFALNYADAGQITLQFRYALPSPPAGQFVQGASNAFVVRPFGFAFTGVSHDATPSGSAAAFAAGDNFSMTLGAYLWASGQDANNDGIPDSGQVITGNGVTPNFAATTTVGVPAGGNLAGADGAITRAGGAPTVTAAQWSGGTAVVNNWRYDEVGNVRLTASSDDYLGDASADIRGDSSNDGAVGYVGRFRPKQFVVSAAGLTTRLAAACGPASPFTYMNERLRLTFTLTAQNTQGSTTANYTGTYAKLVLTSFGSYDLGARDGATDLSARLEDPGAAAPPTGSWLNGVASGVTITTALRRALAPDNPDGPYAALQFGIAPIDSDLTAMNTLDQGTRKNLGLTTDVRYGRLRMDNALGSEAHRLAIPMRVEYWNGTGFATNLADECTSLGRSAIAMAFTPPSNLASCETALDVDPVTFTQGVAKVGLTAPGAGNSGSVVLTANLGSAGGSYCNPGSFVAAGSTPLSYLLGRWDDAANPDGDANTNYDDKPSARAAFGLYGSQPGSFIYFRESY